MGKPYTPEEITQAYQKLINVQGLVDFVLSACIRIDAEREAEIEGSLTGIFSIIQDNLKEASGIMDRLDMGYEWPFAALWKKAQGAEHEKQNV
jgi:hypothetical protein